MFSIEESERRHLLFPSEPVLSNNGMSCHMYTASSCNELLPSWYRIKEISSLLVCFVFIFRRMLKFIRYIEVYLKFGLVDCVRCKEGFVISRFCSIHFTVILAGLKRIICYTEDFVL